MTEINQQKVAEFSSNMLLMLNNALLGLSVSIGHRTQLFETIASLPPSTSEQIATAAGLNPRYVTEWLGAMVTGHIIVYDAAAGVYTLPAEHAMVLTATAGLNNMARLAPIIGQLGSVESGIIESFKNGGGVSYDAYPDFMALWSEVNAHRLDATLIQDVLPIIPNIITMLQTGIDVLDVGCGDGHVLRLMAKAFPNSHFTGYDLVQDAIDTANNKADADAIDNVVFKKSDILAMDDSQKYHLITAFDAVHDLAKPAAVLQAIAGSLTPEGTFLMVDLAASSYLEKNLDHPLGPWLYTSSCMHCVSVSMEQGGEGLGAMWGEEKALSMLNEAGFSQVDIQRIANDPFNNYYIATA